MKSLRQLINLVESVQTENWEYTRPNPDDLWKDRDFTGRLPHNSSDNGYFEPEPIYPGGTTLFIKKHKKWPQYDLMSDDGGKSWKGSWTGTRMSGESIIPNINNNGWIHPENLVDADDVPSGFPMPHDLVDTSGMKSKAQGMGLAYTPGQQAKRVMQMAKQMGLKDWHYSQGYEMTSNRVPYCLRVSPGKKFEATGMHYVRVPIEAFLPQERADLAKARWVGSMSCSIVSGGYSTFGGSEEDDDELPDFKKTGAAAAATAADKADDLVYNADAKPGTPTEKIKAIPVDPKVKSMQDEILAKDPKALPKFGADGKLGSETVAAMAKYPDIAKKYMGQAMVTGMTIGNTFNDIAKGVKDIGSSIKNFGSGLIKGIFHENQSLTANEIDELYRIIKLIKHK
jgi:hypothetical protein